MIRAKTAYTFEIDDCDAAITGILEQLSDLPTAAHRIGIVTCSYDYIEVGVIRMLAETLDFPIVGMTTVSQAVPGESGLLMLSLMVLSSDDCRFVPSVTAPLGDVADIRQPLKIAYRQATENVPEKEKLILLFPPLLNTLAGDNYVDIFSNLSGNVPIFGSICTDDQPETYDNSHTIWGAEAYKDCAVFVLIYGNFSPVFRMISVSNESRLPYKGEITASQDNILQGVNDLSTVAWLEKIGLAAGGRIRPGINSIPFLINRDGPGASDRTAVARALFATTEEQFAVCGGAMPLGAGITVGLCDKDDVMLTTRSAIREITTKFPKRPVLMFSCLGRRFALGTDPLGEVRLAEEMMSPDSNFMLAYSSGEICPVEGDGQIANRFHNYTFVACIL